MTPPTTTYIDSYDLKAIGFVLEEPGEVLSSAEFADLTIAIPTSDGLALTSAERTMGTRRFTLAGWLRAADATTLRTNKHLLAYRTGGGDHVIRLVDDATRRITARRRRFHFSYAGVPRLGGVVARVEMDWEAVEQPCWEDESQTTVNLSTSAAACALGTWKSWPVITVNAASGTVTNPEIILLDSNDAERARLSLVLTLTLGQSVAVDMRARTITHSADGEDAAYRESGSFWPLDPYPGTNDYPTSAWPKVDLAADSGTPTGTAVYRRAWQV